MTEPTCFDEAADSEEWEATMMEEMRAIKHNSIWELVDVLEDKAPIGLKWVYKVKHHADGSIERFKARLIAKGYAQHQGVDFDETFSPVTRFETVRVHLSLGAKLNLTIYQFDVKYAFLNGELEEEFYMTQLEGFVVSGQESKVYRLKKALYRLKQAPRAWYKRIDSYFLKIDFVKNEMSQLCM